MGGKALSIQVGQNSPNITRSQPFETSNLYRHDPQIANFKVETAANGKNFSGRVAPK
jgi:hypothetical protein